MRTRKAKTTAVERIIMEKITPYLIHTISKNITNFNNNNKMETAAMTTWTVSPISVEFTMQA
jgi:hypothetical protein